MKKILLFLSVATALFAIVSCGEKPEDNTIPAQINGTFTTLVKGEIVTGEVNKLSVSAIADDAELALTFYSDNAMYIPAGKYTIGNAVGNYEGKFKNKSLEANIKSGEINVDIEGEGDYTVTGTLRLSNEAGTILKLNATGRLAYETPTDYYYTVKKGQTNVYKIYDLESHIVAQASVIGAEEGTFEVSKNTLASGVDGTWVWVDGYGTEAYLHGKVTVSTSFGKKTFKFEDNHEVLLANCELKSDLTPAYEEPDPFIWGFFTYSVVKSPVVKDMYELTAKLFYRLEGDVMGPEFLSTTVLTSDDDLIMHNLGSGLPAEIVDFSAYNGYDASKYDTTSGRIAPSGGTYFNYHGVKTTFGLSAMTGKYMVMNCQLDPKTGSYAAIAAPIDMGYQAPANLLEVLDASGGIWSCMGELVQ
ncbi:MAG: hypothetical protein J5668_02895 [Bacteroidales bacterium]|nr:hypothetical protein [Bacteroidales bacterium]